MSRSRAWTGVRTGTAAGFGSAGGRNGLLATGGLGQFMLPPFSCCGAGAFMVATDSIADKSRGAGSCGRMPAWF